MIIAICILVCLVVGLFVYSAIQRKKVKNLTELTKHLHACLRQNEVMLDIRYSVDTYAMSKCGDDYMRHLCNEMTNKLSREISERMIEKLWPEVKRRMIQRRDLFYTSPLNLERIIRVGVPLYRVDVENLYLNADNIGGIFQ